MPYRILFVTASSVEAEAISRVPESKAIKGGYLIGDLEIIVLVAGVGSISTAWEMLNWFSVNGRPDLAINAGIAGSYKEDIKIGDVVMPVTDCFADAGIEDGNNFLTLAEAGLIKANSFPFSGGLIHTDTGYAVQLQGILKSVNAITVNTATGSDNTRARLVRKFNPDIESMEGATFFYICRREKIPFLALRAISNLVEIRNKSNWDIKLAVLNLAEKLNEVFLTMLKR
jgi:futalosine hydrolase